MFNRDKVEGEKQSETIVTTSERLYTASNRHR